MDDFRTMGIDPRNPIPLGKAHARAAKSLSHCPDGNSRWAILRPSARRHCPLGVAHDRGRRSIRDWLLSSDSKACIPMAGDALERCRVRHGLPDAGASTCDRWPHRVPLVEPPPGHNPTEYGMGAAAVVSGRGTCLLLYASRDP